MLIRRSIFDYGTSPGRFYRIRHGTSTVKAASMSMTRTRDLSHGCIRRIRDFGHAIASSCMDIKPAREDSRRLPYPSRRRLETITTFMCEVRCCRGAVVVGKTATHTFNQV
jgi:hypothetical protein